jgi:hypothetical protein
LPGSIVVKTIATFKVKGVVVENNQAKEYDLEKENENHVGENQNQGDTHKGCTVQPACTNTNDAIRR